MDVNNFAAYPRISSIQLLNESIALDAGNLVVVVGPNNSGKSHFLDQLEARLVGEDSEVTKENEGLTKHLSIDWGPIKSFPENEFRALARDVIGQENRYGFFEPETLPNFRTRGSTTLDELISTVEAGSRLGAWTSSFVRRDAPLSRVSEADPKQLSSENSFSRVYRNEKLIQNVSHYFNRIFHENISAYLADSGQIAFKMGKAFGSSGSFESGMSPEYLKALNTAPKLWRQGLGMRSVAGLLIRIYSDPRPIVLIDEPEAFLHPPQAAALGEVLKEISVNEKRQFFCATHDRNLLSGISRKSQGAFSIIRLNRAGDPHSKISRQFDYTLVPSDFDRNIKNHCRIRHSSILEGLFADVAIIVENETDALFYEESLDFYWRQQGPESISRRVTPHFVNISGKSNAPSTIKLLALLATPVVAILDSDIIVNKKEFKKTLETLGNKDIQKIIELREKMEKAVAEREPLPAKSENNYDNKLREIFAGKLKHVTPESYMAPLLREMNLLLKNSGLCLPPEGELEDFDRSITANKANWVRDALDTKLHETMKVQNFISRVISECHYQLSQNQSTSSL